MKKHRGLIALAGLSALSTMGASSCKNTPTAQELTIFHTNDIHSHLRAAKSDPFGLGGLAKVSTLLQTLRKTAGTSVTLDAGDYSEGTGYFNIDAGANMLKMMGVMGYNAGCLGNHDFLIGPDQIVNVMKAAGTPFPVMAANLDMSAYPGAAALQAVLPPTSIQTVGGLKIGMIGLTTYELFYNSYLTPVSVTEVLKGATAYANQLRPQVDVLLLLSHNSFTLNQMLAQDVPGLDAVISGHTHLKQPRAVMVSNAGRQVPVVETGAWGQFLGDLKLKVVPRSGSTAPSVQFASYQLHPVTPDLPDDPKIAEMVNAQDDALNAKFGQDVVHTVIAQSDFDLIQADDTESALGNLAVKAYRAATHAELSLEEISLTGVSIARGPTTILDAHDVVPHMYDPATGKEWALRVWNAKGSDLALVFDVFYTVNGLMPLDSPTGWLSSDNTVVNWDSSTQKSSLKQASALPHVALPKVSSILIGGVPLDPSAHYTVAISDGLLLALTLANQTLHLGIDLSQMQDSGLQAWQAIVGYVTQAGKLTLKDFRVGGHSQTVAPDLAVFYYAMDWDQARLSVEVQNLGQTASAPGQLVCSTGLPNDLIAFGTPLQKWSPLPAQSVPVLVSGATAVVQVPWAASGLARGYWPVQCTVSSAGDGYAPNNSAVKVFTNASGG